LRFIYKYKILYKNCVCDVHFATVDEDKFIDICRLSKLNIIEIHHEKFEIKRPFAKPRSRWNNNNKRNKRSMTARLELNLLCIQLGQVAGSCEYGSENYIP